MPAPTEPWGAQEGEEVEEGEEEREQHKQRRKGTHGC